MCFEERNTESRGRPPEARRTCRRTFAVRRLVRSATVAISRAPYFFLPSLRKMYSPAYLTPLPLYGSGLRNERIWAATCPTFCPSIPLTTISVGRGVAIGFFPTRDMDRSGLLLAFYQSSEHGAEDLSAHVLFARVVIGHDAFRGRKNGDAQSIVDPRQGLDRRIDTATRL